MKKGYILTSNFNGSNIKVAEVKVYAKTFEGDRYVIEHLDKLMMLSTTDVWFTEKTAKEKAEERKKR